MFMGRPILTTIVSAGLTLSGTGLYAQVSFSPQTYALKNQPFQVVSGDFNGDARPDVAVLSTAAGTVSILLTSADGTLSAARDFPAITPPASGPVGHEDQEGSRIKGSRVEGLSEPEGRDQAVSQASLPAVPVSNSSCCQYFDGMVVADVNGDGKLDLVVADPNNPTGPSINVLLGNGDGTFGPPIITAMNFLVQVSAFFGVADFNGDNKLDVALCGYDGNASGPFTMLGNGDGTFTPGVINFSGVCGPIAGVVADVNGDGKPDIVMSTLSGSAGGLTVFLGNGDGTFKPGQQVQEETSWSFTLVAGDFNHDGRIDLASASYQWYHCEFGVCTPVLPPGALAMLSGNGDGSFGGPGELATGSYGLATTGDFDGDGNFDIAAFGWPTVSPAPSVIMLGDGKGDFPTQSVIPFTSGWGVVSADFNGDGLTDIALLNCCVNPTVQVELNTTPGFILVASAAGPAIYPGGSATYTVSVSQQNGFSGSVNLTCSAPASVGISCSLSPVSVNPGGTAMLIVNTMGVSSGLMWPGAGSGWVYALGMPLGTILLGSIGSSQRQTRQKKLIGLVLCYIVGGILMLQVGCAGGGGSHRTGGTGAGNYTITISGTSGSLRRSTTATLIVQ
jgi:hypothetical protein